MLFNSLEFLIFFPIVVMLYFGLNPKYRVWLLLIASYYFYMSWKAEYAVLILVSTVIDYTSALQLEKVKEDKKRKYWLYASLFTNLGILFFFKYFNLFGEAANTFFSLISLDFDVPIMSLLLPVGISFYTFQSMAYTIDVYNRKLPAEKNFSVFALYVSFFPQLVAGPIERATNLLPQFNRTNSFNVERAIGGVQQMLWGFFKKVVIADRLAILVNEVYNAPTEYSGITFVVATFLFAIQIYCDFSGYSDIAIGAARIMGYDLMDNFKVPYLSKSVREFWKRWHISLSTWFQDYLYIPLGGNRVKVRRWYLNLFIVFVVSGFWHGANWTFLIWGALHGFYLIGEIILSKKFPKVNLPNIFKIFFTFILVCLAWLFFRANSLSDAYLVLQKLVEIPSNLSKNHIIESVFWKGSKGIMLANYFIALLFLAFDPLVDREIKKLKYGGSMKLGVIFSALMIVLIVLLGEFGEINFIYFQF